MLNLTSNSNQFVSSSSPRNKSVNVNEQITIMRFMTLQTKMESDTFFFPIISSQWWSGGNKTQSNVNILNGRNN